MANLFLSLLRTANNEDYFTASWQYLIDNIPLIGQAIVDRLFAQTGKLSPKFVRAINHPLFFDKNYPDFLLECEEVNIICEHKLESSLGDRQLERYLELASQQPKKTYLALISRSNQVISSDVTNSDKYLHPPGSEYFRWQDFYPVISANNDRLAREFLELMQVYGMKPPTLTDSWQDLFTNRATIDRFKQQWEMVRSYFNSFGARRCKIDSKDPFGFQIGYPLNWLHLLYCCTREIDDCPLDFLEEHYLKAIVWIPETEAYVNEFQVINEKFFSANNLRIFMEGTEPMGELKTKDGTVAKHIAIYYTELSQILSPDSVATQKALLDFAVSVFNHIQKLRNDLLSYAILHK